MRITESQLRRIIQEEVRALREQEHDVGADEITAQDETPIRAAHRVAQEIVAAMKAEPGRDMEDLIYQKSDESGIPLMDLTKALWRSWASSCGLSVRGG